MEIAKRVAAAIALAAVLIFFGYLIADSGRGVLRNWSSIGPAYAGVGLLWIVAGPAMFVAGVWILASLGRRRIPLWVGGIAAALSGATLVAGVLTYVVPCSGPS